MDDNLENDKSLQIIRIEKNKSLTIFLYYKPYPPKDNSKFDHERTIILFYFEAEYVNEKFLKEYLSLAGDIESINFGKYLNKKGCKKKRRVVQFAVVTFHNKSAVQCILDRTNFQLKVNDLIERKRGGLSLEYDPTRLDGVEDAEVDEDGFVKVSGNSKITIKI
jgi:hypothetical protein